MHTRKDSQNLNKRIVLISRRPCFPLGMGGAELSSYLLMQELNKLGYDVIIVGELLPESRTKFIENIALIYPYYKIKYNNYGFIINARKTFKFALVTTSGFYDYSTTLLSTWKPDFVFTQLEGCMEIISFAQNKELRGITIVR